MSLEAQRAPNPSCWLFYQFCSGKPPYKASQAPGIIYNYLHRERCWDADGWMEQLERYFAGVSLTRVACVCMCIWVWPGTFMHWGLFVISYVGCAYVVLSWFVFLVSSTYLTDIRELQVSWLVWMPQSTWGKNDGVCLGNNRSFPKGWGKFWPLDSLMVNLGSSLEPWSCTQVVRCGGLHKTLSHKSGHGNSIPISPTPSPTPTRS